MMVNLEHTWLIPRYVADPALHRSDATGVDLYGNGFNGLAFECAELPYHVPKEMVARLTPPKTVPEGRMKGMEFVEEPLDLTGIDIEMWKRVYVAWSATLREHLSFSSVSL